MTPNDQLRRVAEQHVQRLMDVYDLERLRLYERLGDIVSGNPFVRLTETVREIRNFGRRLRRTLRRQISENSREMESLAVRDLFEDFQTPRQIARQAANRRGGRLVLDATVDSVVSRTVADLQRRAVLAMRRAPNVVARILAGRRRSRTEFFGRQVALVARVESFRAYNETVVDGARADQATGRRKFRKRISEVRDRRNHPFSRAANGVTAPVNQPFKVPQIAVRNAASAMGKSASGIFWPVDRGNYVGYSLPAHYNDRGRVIIEST